MAEFPRTVDQSLTRNLSSTVVEARNRDNVFVSSISFESLSGESEVDPAKVSLPAGSELVFKSTNDCEDLVQHFGSHFGDLVEALKLVVYGVPLSGAFFFLLSLRCV
jgi:hypothetical protein